MRKIMNMTMKGHLKSVQTPRPFLNAVSQSNTRISRFARKENGLRFLEKLRARDILIVRVRSSSTTIIQCSSIQFFNNNNNNNRKKPRKF